MAPNYCINAIVFISSLYVANKIFITIILSSQKIKLSKGDFIFCKYTNLYNSK